MRTPASPAASAYGRSRVGDATYPHQVDDLGRELPSIEDFDIAGIRHLSRPHLVLRGSGQFGEGRAGRLPWGRAEAFDPQFDYSPSRVGVIFTAAPVVEGRHVSERHLCASVAAP